MSGPISAKFCTDLHTSGVTKIRWITIRQILVFAEFTKGRISIFTEFMVGRISIFTKN